MLALPGWLEFTQLRTKNNIVADVSFAIPELSLNSLGGIQRRIMCAVVNLHISLLISLVPCAYKRAFSLELVPKWRWSPAVCTNASPLGKQRGLLINVDIHFKLQQAVWLIYTFLSNQPASLKSDLYDGCLEKCCCWFSEAKVNLSLIFITKCIFNVLLTQMQ